LLSRISKYYIKALLNYYSSVRYSVIWHFCASNYTLVSLSSFLKNTKRNVLCTYDEENTIIKGPRFVGEVGSKLKSLKKVTLRYPRLYAVLTENTKVLGGTDFFFSEGYAVHPDVYKPIRDVCPAELNGIVILENSFKTISICLEKELIVTNAISLLGSCTGNYAHWLTETLPKLLIIDSIDAFNDYPLLVDSWIHPRFIETINLLGKNKRELIKVPRWRAVSVKSLISISPTSYTPPELRSFLQTKKLGKPDPNLFGFSKHGLHLLRKIALRNVKKDSKLENKLYLTRSIQSTGNHRLLLNSSIIEDIVKSRGYKIVNPAELAFHEQVQLFSNATKVISPIGAAIANTIFSRRGCQVLALSPYYENANYYYFSNFMGVLGHELHYVLGEQKNSGAHILHNNYEVDIKKFLIALDFLEQ